MLPSSQDMNRSTSSERRERVQPLGSDGEMIFHHGEEAFLHHFILLVLFSAAVHVAVVPMGINKELFLNSWEMRTFVEGYLLSGVVVMAL